MDTAIYNKNVKLAFTAVLVYAISAILLPFADLVGGLQSTANDFGASAGGFWVVIRYLVNIAYLAGVACFAYALFNLKNTVEGQEAQDAVNLVFIGAAIAAVAAVLDFFVGGFIMGLFGIAVAVIYIIGYNKIKVAAGIPDAAKSSAALCFVAAIIMLVGAVLSLIPLAGGVLNFILCIPAFILLIIGWKKAVVTE